MVVLVAMRSLGHLLSLFYFGRRDVTDVILENLALRQQLALLQRSVKGPRLRRHDRAFCLLRSRVSAGFITALSGGKQRSHRVSGSHRSTSRAVGACAAHGHARHQR